MMKQPSSAASNLTLALGVGVLARNIMLHEQDKVVIQAWVEHLI